MSSDLISGIFGDLHCIGTYANSIVRWHVDPNFDVVATAEKIKNWREQAHESLVQVRQELAEAQKQAQEAEQKHKDAEQTLAAYAFVLGETQALAAEAQKQAQEAVARAERAEGEFTATVADFKAALAHWHPSDFVPEGETHRWKINADSSVSITLPSTVAANLGDVLNEWARVKGWLDRPDCQNWRRSAKARENRRESIVYGNLLETMKCYLGRPQVLLLMEWAKETTMDRAIREAADTVLPPRPLCQCPAGPDGVRRIDETCPVCMAK